MFAKNRIVRAGLVGGVSFSVLALAGLAGCDSGLRPVPGGATEAAVFFTPAVREARRAAGEYFRSQGAEYARRDDLVGARPLSGRADLYPPTPRSRDVYRVEETRVRVTDDGYRVTERSAVRSGVDRHGAWGRRRR